jgi:hypothetical protein
LTSLSSCSIVLHRPRSAHLCASLSIASQPITTPVLAPTRFIGSSRKVSAEDGLISPVNLAGFIGVRLMDVAGPIRSLRAHFRRGFASVFCFERPVPVYAM